MKNICGVLSCEDNSGGRCAAMGVAEPTGGNGNKVFPTIKKNVALRALATALIAVSFLSGCGKVIGNNDATACMQSTADSANNVMGLANMLLDAGNKIPPMRITDTKVQECAKTGPGTYVCLIGYNLHFDGELGKFHRMTMGLDPDANGNIPTQAKWEFVKGETAIQCQKLD
ncbi:MAG: hypothetical protein RBR34_03745 [Rhodospirillaceae bacterium]|nr:hypothetical protein [Rhodospirillaceae bacterium]